MNSENELITLYTGCPFYDIRHKLQNSGLRPTKQRLELGWLLFSKGHRHITADLLYQEATKSKVIVSQATIYNTLNQFKEYGLLKEIRSEGAKVWYDTNPVEHYHLYDEDNDILTDLPATAITIHQLPQLGNDIEVSSIDLVIRFRSKQSKT